MTENLEITPSKATRLKKFTQDIFKHQLPYAMVPGHEQEGQCANVAAVREMLKRKKPGWKEEIEVWAKNGDVNAMVFLGQLLYDRTLDELLEDINIDMGAQLLVDEIINETSPMVKDQLAQHRKKKACKEDHIKAYEYFAKAYENGSIFAMYYLASIWSEGLVPFADIAKPSTLYAVFMKKWDSDDLAECGIGRECLLCIRLSLMAFSGSEEVIARANKEKEREQDRNKELTSWLRQSSHSISHLFHPTLLNKTAGSLTSHDYSDRKNILLLKRESLNERFYMAETKIMADRYTRKKSLAACMMRERRVSPKDAKCLGVKDILDNVLLRIFFDVLVGKEQKYDRFCEYLCSISNMTVENLGRSFTDIALMTGADIAEWAENTFRLINLNWEESVWKKIRFPEMGCSDVVLTIHLQELILNAIKYADYKTVNKSGFLINLMFSGKKQVIEGQEISLLTVLSSNCSGVVPEVMKHSMGTGSGQALIRNDICYLNGDSKNNYSFDCSETQAKEYNIQLAYKERLLYFRSPFDKVR